MLEGFPKGSQQGLYIPFPNGPVDHAGLTKTASPGATPGDLQGHPVMDGLHVRENRGTGIGGAVQVWNQALPDPGRTRPDPMDLPDPTVRMVTDFKVRRDVDTLDTSEMLEKILPLPETIFLEKVGDFFNDFLTVPDDKEIEKIGKRFRIEGTRAAPDDEGIGETPFRRKEGNSREIQHVQDIGITHFILEGEPDDIEGTERKIGLQTAKRPPFPSKDFLHVFPGGVDPFSKGILPPVEDFVEDFKPEMRHPDLVGIGEGQGILDVYAIRFFPDRVDFISYVPGGP